MQNFDKSWEQEYSKGNSLNEYPFDFIVTLTFKYFGKVKNKGSVKVLDVGCGAGNNSEFFAKEGFDVFGIDGSDTAIEYTKEKFKNKGLNGKFKKMFFEDIQDIDEKFDLIIDRESIYSLEWSDVVKTYSHISTKLKKNGIFISFFYNKEHPDMKYLSNTSDGNTFYKPLNGSFGNSNRVTLFDINSIFKCTEQANLKITLLYDHKITPIISSDFSDNGISEYIFVATRN